METKTKKQRLERVLERLIDTQTQETYEFEGKVKTEWNLLGQLNNQPFELEELGMNEAAIQCYLSQANFELTELNQVYQSYLIDRNFSNLHSQIGPGNRQANELHHAVEIYNLEQYREVSERRIKLYILVHETIGAFGHAAGGYAELHQHEKVKEALAKDKELEDRINAGEKFTPDYQRVVEATKEFLEYANQHPLMQESFLVYARRARDLVAKELKKEI